MSTNEPRDIESILTEIQENVDPELNFDRFMEGVVEKQSKNGGKLVTEEESPIRKLNRRARETPANRTRYTR